MLRYLALVCLIGLFACGSTSKTPYHWGMAMEESCFLDVEPLNVINYRVFLFELKNYRADTSAFMENIQDTTLLVQRYPGVNGNEALKHFKFGDSLLVGVSYSQALNYCKWRTETVRRNDSKARGIWYSLPSPEDFKEAERLAAGKKDKNNWKYLFEGPPELTNIPGYVWVKSKEGGRLVEASEVPAHEITFRCKAELMPYSGTTFF